MSVLALPPHLVQAPAPLDPQADWITPEEQLNRLALPIAKELVNKNRDKLRIFSNEASENHGDPLEESIIECVTRSILRRSDLSDKGSKKRIPSLMDLTVEHLLEPILFPSLPPELTTWYKALKLIDKLPKKMPPLPQNSFQILDGNCPKQICDKIKPDGTAYKIKEKCTLLLVPQELEDPDKFEKVVKSYGEKHYPENANPLQYRCFWDEAREQHGKTPFGPTCWILHTNDVLEGSRNKSWAQQAAMVDTLARETFVNWQVPESFWETFLTITLTEIGTGTRLYPLGNRQNGILSIWARSKQMTQDYHLVVGGTAPFGVDVSEDYGNDDVDLGVSARLILGT
jgi:hypothetical protein